MLFRGVDSAEPSSGFEPPLPLNWLRLSMENIYTEVPLFLLAAGVIGVLSPSAAVLFVLSFGAFDVVASAMHPEELRFWALRPFPIAGRLVAYWVLWLLAVELPVIERALALSVRSLARSRMAVAVLNGVAAGAFTYLWTQAAAVLIRPVYLWSDIGGPHAQGFIPLQIGGLVIGLVVGGAAAAVALARGPSGLLSPAPRGPAGAEKPRTNVNLVAAFMRRIVLAALLTIGLGGLILTALDAVVLFVAIAGAGPLARWIASRSPVGAIAAWLPPIIRIAVAMAIVLGVALLMVGVPAIRGVSEFFSIIAVVAVGLFVIGLLTAGPPKSSDLQPSAARAVVSGTALAFLLLMAGLALPVRVFADNGASFADLWNTVLVAAFAGMGIPLLLWAVDVRDDYFGPAASNYERDLWGPEPPPPPPPMVGPTKRPWMAGDPLPKGWMRGKDGGKRPDGSHMSDGKGPTGGGKNKPPGGDI